MLKYGFSSRIESRLCVQTLGILILEMPDTLARQLPEILFEMSKMSNTITLSIPVLEFLSSKILILDYILLRIKCCLIILQV